MGSLMLELALRASSTSEVEWCPPPGGVRWSRVELGEEYKKNNHPIGGRASSLS